MMEVYQSSRTQKEFHCHDRPEGGIADLRIFFCSVLIDRENDLNVRGQSSVGGLGVKDLILFSGT